MNANESTYKKDFENALEMIEWQNTMLRKQAEEIEYWKEKFNKAMELQQK